MKFNRKSIFPNFISLALELRTVKQRHPYFHPSRTPSHHFRPRTNCRGLLSKPNQEQGRIHVWSESAPAPPFWQINHANSAYFRLFLGYFRVISATRPPPPFNISWIHPCKNHHFVICTALTSYLSLNFIITNNHTELQSPRGRRFCLQCWSTFYGTIQGYTKRGGIYLI